MIATYEDAVENLLDYLGSDPSQAALRDAKKAVQEAYRDLTNAHTWTYLYTSAQVHLSGPVIPGLITYAQSSGARPFLVTLASGSFPAWSHDALMIIGPTSYRVDRLLTTQTLTLEELSNPGIDITTPVKCIMYRDVYPLPHDFISQDIAFIPNNFSNLTYRHPREWVRANEGILRMGPPQHFTILGGVKHPGRFTFNVFPCPDVEYNVHYAYKRRPRPMATYRESTGFMTFTNGTSIVGSGGATFSQADEGAVIRISGDSVNLPTNETGDNPAYFESQIIAVTDQTHATIKDSCPEILMGVCYTISDVLDIEAGAMMSAFNRLCEQKLSVIRIMQDRKFPKEEYTQALERAKCADSRSMGPRAEHHGGSHFITGLWGAGGESGPCGHGPGAY